MLNKIFKFCISISYYPRCLLDRIIHIIYVRNDFSILNIFKDKDTLIVANGPSLNSTPLDQIDMPSIGMNKINLIFNRTEWRPNLIVCVNGLVLMQNRQFFNETQIPLILPIKSLYLGIKKRKNIIFLPISSSKEFSLNIKKNLGAGATVSYSCLQVALHSSVKSVNFVGLDHNFKFNGKSHSIDTHDGDDQNHFDPDYFKDQRWALPDLSGSEYGYLVAKNIFDQRQIPIIDYTINGKLDIFEKKDINLLINNSK